MFEHLDDPRQPDPAPIGGVEARGRQIRFRRRSIFVGATAMVLVGVVAAAAALQNGDGAPKKVVIAAPSTTDPGDVTDSTPPPSTTVPESTTTVPENSTPTTAVGGETATTVAPPVTDPPHDPFDLAMVRIAYGDALSIVSGAERSITYTVTNTGTWTVNLDWNPMCPTTVWSHGNTPYWKAFDDVFPQPYPTRGSNFCHLPMQRMTLAPGESKPFTQQVLAGYTQGGNVMPAALGQTSVDPPFLPQCTQPCASNRDRALNVVIYPPEWNAIVDFTFADKDLNAAAGASTKVDLTYHNPLAFTVKTPIYGPCWTVTSGTATVDCSGPIPTVVIGPNATVKLQATLYARKGMVASGSPLAPGRYPVKVGYYRTEEGPETGGVFLTVT